MARSAEFQLFRQVLSSFHAIRCTSFSPDSCMFFFSFSVHNLYPPHAQPGLYPPPRQANPREGYRHQYYQGYSGGAEQPPYSYGHSTWPGQAAPSDDAGPFHYHDDADCITFLRGWYILLCSMVSATRILSKSFSPCVRSWMPDK
jgi:hypothetical protein